MTMTNMPTRFDPEATATIMGKTERLLKVDAQNHTADFQNAQLLLSEYMAMLSDAQLENSRLHKLLGNYERSSFAAKGLPASRVIADLTRRIRKLGAVTTKLRTALERIQASASRPIDRTPGEIASSALRDSGTFAGHADGKR